jgi:hypothetical protein
LILYVILAAYVGANIFNLQFWPFSYFNPRETAIPIYRNLDYPTKFLFESEPPLIVHVDITLMPDAPLAQGVPAKISAAGSVNRSYAQAISDVYVGFIGAISYIPNYNVREINFEFAFVVLRQNYPPTNYVGNVIGPLIGGISDRIVWNRPGDFEPFMVIGFRNYTTLPLTFPYLAVHVDSLDVARSERYNRVDIAVSVALVAFGFVEAARLLEEMAEKRNQSKGAANPTTTTIPPKRASDTK